MNINWLNEFIKNNNSSDALIIANKTIHIADLINRLNEILNSSTLQGHGYEMMSIIQELKHSLNWINETVNLSEIKLVSGMINKIEVSNVSDNHDLNNVLRICSQCGVIIENLYNFIINNLKTFNINDDIYTKYSLTSTLTKNNIDTILKEEFNITRNQLFYLIISTSNITTIDTQCFIECSNLRFIYINSSITTINDYAFYECLNLCRINLDNVSSIGKFAFSGTNLSSINVSNATLIQNNAFQNCYNLTSVIINGNKNYTLSGSSFMNCVKLNTLTLNTSGTASYSISANVFRNCNNLTGCLCINNKSVRNIGNYAFSGTSFTSVILKNVNVISYSFSSCSNLKILMGTFTIIGLRSFYNCSNLTTILASITFDSTLYGNVQYSFSNTSLRYVDFNYLTFTPGNYRYIFSNINTLTNVYNCNYLCEGMFDSCPHLSNVDITEDITTIPNTCFRNDISLINFDFSNISQIFISSFANCGIKKLNISSSCVFNEASFKECSNLNFINFSSSNILDYEFMYESFADCGNVVISGLTRSQIESLENYNDVFKNTNLYYADEMNEVLLINDNTLNLINYTGNVLTKDIVNKLILGRKITTVIISATNITTIDENCFESIPYISRLILSPYITRLNDFALYNTNIALILGLEENLTTLTLTTNLHYFGKYSLSGTLIFSLSFIKSYVELNDYAFFNCLNLTSITLPTNDQPEEVFGNGVFMNCKNLESYTDNNTHNIKSINKYMFKNCSKLKTVSFTDDITVIGEEAFINCSSLTSISGISNVNVFGDACFAQCNDLTLEINDVIDNSLYIGNYACINSGCVINLNLDLDEDIVGNIFIGDFAFVNTGESELNITSYVDLNYFNVNIGNYAFANSGLKTLISRGITTLGISSFINTPITTDVQLKTTSIPNECFYESTLPNLIISTYSMKPLYINEKAFMNCANLNNVSLTGKGVDELYGKNIHLNDLCFCNCSSITSVNFNSGFVRFIGTKHFYNCSSLTSLNNGYFYELGDYSFALPTITTNILTFTNIKIFYYIGSYTFTNRIISGIKFITVHEIGNSCFENCEFKTDIFPLNIETCNEKCFYNAKFTNTTLTGEMNGILNQAFYGSNLTNVNISCQTMGSLAFENTNITSIINTNNSIYLSSYAINCKNLTTLNLGKIYYMGTNAIMNYKQDLTEVFDITNLVENDIFAIVCDESCVSISFLILNGQQLNTNTVIFNTESNDLNVVLHGTEKYSNFNDKFVYNLVNGYGYIKYIFSLD